MVKYTTNCFLATKITFFNEIYKICKESNVNYSKVAQLTTLDKRITKYGTAVPGEDGQFYFGGKCFPKDLNALTFHAKELGIDPLLLESVWSSCIMRKK